MIQVTIMIQIGARNWDAPTTQARQRRSLPVSRKLAQSFFNNVLLDFKLV